MIKTTQMGLDSSILIILFHTANKKEDIDGSMMVELVNTVHSDGDVIYFCVKNNLPLLGQRFYDLGRPFNIGREVLGKHLFLRDDLYDLVRNIKELRIDSGGYSLLYHMKRIGREDIVSLLLSRGYKMRMKSHTQDGEFIPHLLNIGCLTRDETENFFSSLPKLNEYNSDSYPTKSKYSLLGSFFPAVEEEIENLSIIGGLTCDDCSSLVKDYLPFHSLTK